MVMLRLISNFFVNFFRENVSSSSGKDDARDQEDFNDPGEIPGRILA